MSHFTYQNIDNPDILSQGDILEKKDSIKEIIKEIHPHYLKDDYKYFIILTQSCDLVPRTSKNECKSKYITLAAIRPLESLLNKQMQNYIDDKFYNKINLCSNNYKLIMKQFLGRLLNNNEPEYFFLNEDVDYSL